jgi:hypothetical protein
MPVPWFGVSKSAENGVQTGADEVYLRASTVRASSAQVPGTSIRPLP